MPFIAEATGFGNNCGFNCLAHVLIDDLMNMDSKKQQAQFEHPTYIALLNTFKKFYNIPNANYKHFIKLFMTYDNPIDREAILSPVLRQFLIDVLKSPHLQHIYPIDKRKEMMNHWNARLKTLENDPREMIEDDDLKLMGQLFQIKISIKLVQMKEPYELNPELAKHFVRQVVLYNSGQHWEYEVDSDVVAEAHNYPYQAMKTIEIHQHLIEEFTKKYQGDPSNFEKALNEYQSMIQKKIDTILKDSHATFAIIMKPGENSQKITDEIKLKIHTELENAINEGTKSKL